MVPCWLHWLLQCALCCYQTAKARTLCIYLHIFQTASIFVFMYFDLPLIPTGLRIQPPTYQVAKYYTTSPKYFPGGCFVVYRLLFASFSVNSKLVRLFRSFSVPFRSFSVPFRSFWVLFGPFRSFSVLFGV